MSNKLLSKGGDHHNPQPAGQDSLLGHLSLEELQGLSTPQGQIQQSLPQQNCFQDQVIPVSN